MYAFISHIAFILSSLLEDEQIQELNLKSTRF